MTVGSWLAFADGKAGLAGTHIVEDPRADGGTRGGPAAQADQPRERRGSASPRAQPEVPLRGKHLRKQTLRAAGEGYEWTLPGAEQSVLDSVGRGLRDAIAPSSDDIYRSRMSVLKRWLLEEGWGNGRTLDAKAVDRALLIIFGQFLDGSLKGGKAAVGQLFSAVKHAYPEWALPLAARFTTRVIPRVAPGGERKGLPWELVLLGAIRMRERGWYESGLRTLLKFDCLCRGEDVENLRVKDVVAARGRVVLRLGTALDNLPTQGASRPEIERTKTGADGGVVIECGWLASEIRALCRGRPASAYLFQEDRGQWERKFREVFSELGVSKPVPHQLRHGGASHMVDKGKSLWDVLVRGRWESKTSVKRYAKPWATLIAWSTLPDAVVAAALAAGADAECAWDRAAPVARTLF